MNTFFQKLSMMILCGTAAGGIYAASATIPSVRVEKVTEVSKTESKVYVGTVNASETVDIVARIDGVMWKSAFREGSLVKKGDLLFQIEDTIYKENVNAAKATLKQTLAELNYAAKEKKRYETLYKSSATAQTTYENAVRSYQVYEGKLDEARANLVLAENNLSYTKIYSPVDGQIGKRFYSEGNYITPEKGTLATIVCFNPIKIQFSMSEADFFRHFGKDQKGKSELEIIRADGQKFSQDVKLDFIDNQVDANTGTLMLQFKADNPKMELIPGGYVTVKFIEKFDAPRPAVNVSALMTDGKNHFVYLVDKDNKVEKRNVVIGNQIYDRQLILSGLNAGDRVIVGGLHKTAPGGTVNPVGMAEPNK